MSPLNFTSLQISLSFSFTCPPSHTQRNASLRPPSFPLLLSLSPLASDFCWPLLHFLSHLNSQSHLKLSPVVQSTLFNLHHSVTPVAVANVALRRRNKKQKREETLFSANNSSSTCVLCVCVCVCILCLCICVCVCVCAYAK